MASLLSWIDHDSKARERTLRILSLFQEKESRDELGLGSVRDSFADQLFPGTSTIQTRLRYMLFVPWIYDSLEAKRLNVESFAVQADKLERDLVQPLMDSDDQAGVFGKTAGKKLKRLPSSVYWAGLGVWGIRLTPFSQDEYHRRINEIYRRRSDLKTLEKDAKSRGDDEQSINAFAILGEDNAKLEEEIAKHEAELGNEADKSGLLGEFLDAQEKFKGAKKAHDDKSSELEGKLRDKANKADTEIKHNKMFGDPNYNVLKIEKDISTVTEDTYSPLTDEQAEKDRALLKEEPKSEIPQSSPFNLRYAAIVSKTKELVEKKIQVSAPIQELLNDAALAEWVRAGRKQHQGKRDKCAFCGSDLPSDLWKKLDKHFNQESEKLRQALSGLLGEIDHERSRVPNLLKIGKNGCKFLQVFYKFLQEK